MAGNMNEKELAELRAQGKNVRADPGQTIYLLQGNPKTNKSRIVKVDDQGNKEVVENFDTIAKGQAVLAAYSESLEYIKH